MLVCAALAACAVSPTQDAAPREAASPAPAAAPEGETERDSAARTPPEPEIDADPARLAGLDRRALEAMLGAPSFQRIDGPAALLRYRHAACVLDLFLYAPPKRKAAAARVDHFEARKPDGTAMETRDCLAALLRARAARQPG